jgi:hypothetical protein
MPSVQKANKCNELSNTAAAANRSQSKEGRLRYVIIAVSIAFFLIWDGLKNDGEYLAQGVRMMVRAFSAIGL